MPFFSRVLFALFLVSPFLFKSYSQEFSTNRNPVGLEYNILFHADTQYTISQTGSATLEVPRLFDGTLVPSYTNTAPSDLDPTVILIEGLPDKHIQGGAWTGWTTRYWYPRRFKIEGYDAFNGLNSWQIIADYSSQNYGSNDFSVSVPAGSYTKLRFTFYEGSGTNGHMGISEIYFLHPEATSPYATLLSNGVSNLWNGDGTDISYTTGNVGIGVTDAAAKLDLNGTMRVREGTGVTDGDVQLFNHDGATYGFLIRPFDSSFNGGTWDWNKDFGYRLDTKNWYVETGFGVGTTDVGTYKLAVNGNIRAKEINVEMG